MITKIVKIITCGFFLLAVWIIGKEVRIVGAKNLITLIQNTPMWIMGIAGIGIFANYFVLAGYDWLALKYIKKKLPFGQVLKAAGISFAFSNTTGHTYAAGGAIRYWFYVPWGVPKVDILKMILFETVTILIGIGISFILATGLIPWTNFKPNGGFYMIGWGIGILFILYIVGIVLPKRKIHIKKISLPSPDIRMIFYQTLVGLMDNITLFLIFYTFLRYHLNAPILESFTIFIIAQSIGFMAQVPGGLGVFEGSFLYLYPHADTEKSGILASLILFRIFYYFVPFLMAMGYLGVNYIRKKSTNT